MALLAFDHRDRLLRRSERALTLVTVLAAVEVLRRSPRWLLIAAGLLALVLIGLILAYLVWIEVALATVVAWRLGRGFIRGWREAR
jgi:hypothetical protein